jgi:hypothetical protein
MVIVMGKAFVKGGTPVGSESLCKTCSSAHIMTGYRESELVTICNDVHPNIVVPFTIYECTGYYDKNRPSWDDMKKFALHISPGESKPRGFKFGPGFGGAAAAVRLVPGTGDEDDEDDDD